MAEMNAVPMIASWLMLLLVVAFVAGVGCVLSARTRTIGVVLLAILAFGLFSVRVQVHRSMPRAAQIEAINQHGPVVVHRDNNLIVESIPHMAEEHARRAEEAAKAAAARAQADIVRNQRLTAQMHAVVVQHSPNGDILETYLDGMQVRQKPSGFREIVREADEGPALASAPEFRSDLSLYVLGAPLLVLAIAFVALRTRARALKYGLGVVVAGALAMVVIGVRSSRWQEVYIPEGVEVPLVHAPTMHDQADQIREAAPQLEAAPTAPYIPATTIEEAWSHLTGPRIRLDDDGADAKVSPKELVAAKTVLTTTAPGVDPLTQSWLASVAKATLQALAQTSKASEDQSQLAWIEAGRELVRQQDTIAAAQAKAANEAAAQAAAEPRPEWLEETPTKLVGNSRRMVVSSDPFVSAAEAQAALREKLRAVVHARLEEVVEGANGGEEAFVPGPEQLGITDEFIASELCLEEYVETLDLSVGRMKRAHALVEFAEAKDRMMLDRWIVFAQRQSIENLGRMSLLAVGGLGLVFGLLKVDTWTRGYYTKRLFIGVPAAIIALMLLTLA
jgi:hypothetical protein